RLSIAQPGKWAILAVKLRRGPSYSFVQANLRMLLKFHNLLSGLYVVHNERTAQVAISDDLVLLKAFLGVIPVSEHIDNALTGPVALLPKSTNVVIDLRAHKQRNVRPKVITELVVVRDNLTLVRARLNLKSYVYSTSKFNLITTRERGCNKTLDTANV